MSELLYAQEPSVQIPPGDKLENQGQPYFIALLASFRIRISDLLPASPTNKGNIDREFIYVLYTPRT